GAEGAAQQASYADLPWWEVFKDDQLKSLIDAALANTMILPLLSPVSNKRASLPPWLALSISLPLIIPSAPAMARMNSSVRWPPDRERPKALFWLPAALLGKPISGAA